MGKEKIRNVLIKLLELLAILSIFVVVITLGLYGFIQYLKWADNFENTAFYNESKQATFQYRLLPPNSLSDSWKVINFWYNYYLLYLG